MSIAFGTRRAEWAKIADAPPPLTADELARFEAVDLFYRSLCALLYNYVPMSGHPGARSPRAASSRGSSSTRWTTSSRKPDREDADVVSYAAGHKAMGLYS
jgi:transketolase